MTQDHNEIERAWELSDLPKPDLITHSIPHEIGYLFSSKVGELRVVRRFHETKRNLPTNTVNYSVTVKTGQAGLSRLEWEDDDFPSWAFNVLWTQVQHVIVKTRYFVTYGSHILEIDQYQKRCSRVDGDLIWNSDLEGKIRLECEFASEKEAMEFELPDWASESTEITGKLKYRNRMIAEYGWPNHNNI